MRRVGKLPAVLLVLWTGTILWMVWDRTQVIQETVREEHSAAAAVAVCPCVFHASYSPEKRAGGEEEPPRGPTMQPPAELRRDDSKRAGSVQNVTHPVLENDGGLYTPNDSSRGSSLSLNYTSKVVGGIAEAVQGNLAKLEAVQQKLTELEEKTLKEEVLFREQKEKTDKLIQLRKELEDRLSHQLKEKQEQKYVKEKIFEKEKLRQEKIAQQQLAKSKKQKVEKKSQREPKEEPEKVHPASVSQNPTRMFDFTISNAKACRKGANTDGLVDALCLVFTATWDSVMRARIRETWGGVKGVKGKAFVTMFLLGQNGATYQESIQKEDDEHHDIIQQNFNDSYYNLTLKTLMGLRWASEFCPNARFVLKMDMDVFINWYNLADRIDSAPAHHFAEGTLKNNTAPIRNTSFKWYTSRDMYPEDKYPPYLGGGAYFISGDLAGPIYKESFKVRYLPWEDAFVGIIMNRLHVEPKLNSGYDYAALDYDNEPDTLLRIIGESIAFGLGENKEKNKDNIVRVWRYVQKLYNVTVV